VFAQAGSGAVGRPHVARALIAAGWARDQRDAFDRFLGAGRPAYVAKQRLTIADAIRLVHDAGGVAVVAHPGREGTRARLEELRAAGMDGVEVRHPGHSAEDEGRLGALADVLDLVPSGGSDWHGAAEGSRVLGAINVPWEWADRQAARARDVQRSGGAPWSSRAGSPS
jgi:predicted metal-dependent phosphoesterase TrpH